MWYSIHARSSTCITCTCSYVQVKLLENQVSRLQDDLELEIEVSAGRAESRQHQVRTEVTTRKKTDIGSTTTANRIDAVSQVWHL